MASTKQQMTRDELEQTPEYRRLSPKMRLWVSAYVQSFVDFGEFDSLWATRQSYQCTTDESARTFGYQMEGNKKVKALVRMFLNSGKTQLELDLEEVQRHLDAAEPGSYIAERLIAQKNSMKRGIKPVEPKSEPGAAKPAAEAKPESDSRVPADALEVWSDKTTGVVIGFRRADGVAVKL